LGVENTIFGPKIIGKNPPCPVFRPVEIVVTGYPLDADRILEKFPMSGIQICLFKMC